ncbi:MAG: GumC family protein [bacterium]
MDPKKLLVKTKTNESINEEHLLDYINICLKRKWIILACLFIAFCTALIQNYNLPPIYQATSQIIIDKERNRSPITGNDMQDYYYYESYYSESLTFQTHFKMITSRPVLEKVVKRLNLDQQRNKGKTHDTHLKKFFAFFTNAQADSAKMEQNIKNDNNQVVELVKEERWNTNFIKAIRGKIEIKQIEDTRLVNITVTDNDPVMASQLANTIPQVYIEYDVENRLQASKNFIHWLTLQIADMKAELEESEKRFFEFKKQERIFSIQGKQNIDTQKIGEFNANYIQAKTERLEIEAKIEKLKDILAPNNNIRTKGIPGSQKKYSIPLIVSNSLLEELKKNLVLLDVELSNHYTEYGPKHPKVIEITKRYKLLEDKFFNELNNVLAKLQAEKAVLQAREEALADGMKQFESEALELTKKEGTYAILQREVETNKTLLDIMINKLKEINLAEGTSKSNLRLVESSPIPQKPIGPKKTRNITLASILGLGFGLFLAFFLEYLDWTIKQPDDVERYLNLPVLAIIPKVKNEKKH